MSGTWSDVIRSVNRLYSSQTQQEYFSEAAIHQIATARQAENVRMRASLLDNKYIHNLAYAMGKQWHFPLWPKILNLPPGA